MSDMTDIRTRIIFGLVVIATASLLVITFARAQSPDFTQSFYNGDGSFAGSSRATPPGPIQGAGTSSFYDHSGHFVGSAIQNNNGTTSFYNGSGRFTGSVVNTSPSIPTFGGRR